MRNLFKTIYIPNADGSNSAVLATNANTVWVETYKGDNVTGNGTREFPYKSLSTANIRAVLIGATYVCFRGVINEIFTCIKSILGDDISQILKTDVFGMSNGARVTRCTIIGSLPTLSAQFYDNLFFASNPVYNVNSQQAFNNIYRYGFSGGYAGLSSGSKYCTFNGLNPNLAASSATVKFQESIINLYFNTYGSYPILNGIIFPSTCNFKYNGISIQQPTWVSDPKQNVQLLRDAYIRSGYEPFLYSIAPTNNGNGTVTFTGSYKFKYACPINGTCILTDPITGTITGTLNSGITASNTATTSITITTATPSSFGTSGTLYIPNTASMTKTVANSTFVKDSFSNETCQIVHNELHTGNGTTPNIFAAYASNVLITTTAASIAASAGITLITSIPTGSANLSGFAVSGDIWIYDSLTSKWYPYSYTSKVQGTGFVGSQHLPAIAANYQIKQYGDVTDFSLNANSGNVALYASSTGGYVGALKPAVPIVEGGSNNTGWGPILVVDQVTGLDTATTGTMLRKTGTLIDFNASVNQAVNGLSWNRIRTGVMTNPNGVKFQGFNGMNTDGSPFGYYFGKHQDLVSSIPVYAIDDAVSTGIRLLTSNTLYKVCNDYDMSNLKQVTYCGNNYPPDTFFSTNPIGTVTVTAGSPLITGTGTKFLTMFKIGSFITINGESMTLTANPTSDIIMNAPSNFAASFSGTYTPPLLFNLMNVSGVIGQESYVKEITASPFESVEVFPYDTPTVASSTLFPFSASFFGLTYCLIYTAAGVAWYSDSVKIAGQQVKFSHIKETKFLSDFPNTHVPALELYLPTTVTNTTTVEVKSAIPVGYPASGMLQIGSSQFLYTSWSGKIFTGLSQAITANVVGTQVTLCELKRDKLSCYDNFGISSADQEYVTLANDKRGYFSVVVPTLQYLKVELNAHFNKAYDQ